MLCSFYIFLVFTVYDSRCFQCPCKRAQYVRICVLVHSARLHLLPPRSPGCHGDDGASCCSPSCDRIRPFYRQIFNILNQYSLCPTFMIIFMDLVLQTPPSWLSMPSMVPLDVAATEGGALIVAASNRRHHYFTRISENIKPKIRSKRKKVPLRRT